jgi:amino acid transporter
MADKLKKNLNLFDVYAMSTGAMFSSGLFLLPGIAAGLTGDSVYLAYLVAGFLILPAMYCMAELSTAMPKAGGTYYFLDRAMGPLVGTIGGLGSWVAVVFKSAFALVGLGAYLGIYLDLPFTLLAIILSIVFGVINIVGAKETTLLQRVLVGALVVILAAFIILGMTEVDGVSMFTPNSDDQDFFRSGVVGFVSTIGLVFVSYAGLTKVASVAEEIENPDVNIPLGMTLSLATATIIYTLGTLILINVLEQGALEESLTPVADAGDVFLDWAPLDLGVILIVVAAIAAFASTGNAGIMSASRYPYAMAKDKLIPGTLAELGRFGTPTKSIVMTVLAMIVVLSVFDVEAVAKLASAFQLVLFALVCIAVIVMRESRIDSYKPGFRVPFYPWMPIAGVVVALWLINEMGLLAVAFTAALLIGCVVWYRFYAAGNLERRGAIFHVHQRLGEQRYVGLERELMTIIHDRTQAEDLTYEALIARSVVKDVQHGDYAKGRVTDLLMETAVERFDSGAEIAETFNDEWAFRPVGDGVYLSINTLKDLTQPELIVFRFASESTLTLDGIDDDAHTLAFLVTPDRPVGLDLRLAGHIAEVVQSDHFNQRWMRATDEKALNAILMRDDHFYHGPIETLPFLVDQLGVPVGELELPASCILAIIERDGELIIATPDVKLLAFDGVAIIGDPEDIQLLNEGLDPWEVKQTALAAANDAARNEMDSPDTPGNPVS